MSPLEGGGTTNIKWLRSAIESKSHSGVSDSLQPHGLHSPWNSPGQNTGVGSLFLLQRIFPTQGLNPRLPHCRRILYKLSYQGSPVEVRAVVKQRTMHRTAVHGEELASSKRQVPRLRSAASGHRREKSILGQQADVSATVS